MDRAAFADALRKRASGVFGTSIFNHQWTGTEAIIDSCIRNGVTDAHHVANILSQVYHETAGHMLGIKETVMPSHKDKNPSDATVIARLNNAFAKGQLPWVKTPYWREGYFGRGPIMLTHRHNYERMGKRLGVNLAANPSLALDPKIGADIAVVGMKDGMFTGRKLADFNFPSAITASVSSNPRRIVNGNDGTDKTVAGYHRAFHTALVAAGWTGKENPNVKAPVGGGADARPDPQPAAPASGGFWTALAAFLSRMFKRT